METPPVPLSYCHGGRLARFLGRNGSGSGLPGKACDRQLTATLSQDLLVASLKTGLRGHIGDPAVQAHRVVLAHELGHDAASVLKAEWRLGADALAFDGLVPALDFAIALRVERRRAHVGHPTEAHEFPSRWQ